MIKNFIAELIHVTNRLKAKNVEVEEELITKTLGSENLVAKNTLTANGDSTLKGNVAIGKNLSIDGDISNTKGTVSLKGNVTVEKNLTVNGTSTLKSDTTAEKNLTVKGNIAAEKNLTVRTIELSGENGTYHHGGFLDFHYNNDFTVDHTSRIIEESKGVIDINGVKFTVDGNHSKATGYFYQRTGQYRVLDTYDLGHLSDNIVFSNSGTTMRTIGGTMGDNDYWRVGGGATGTNAGYLEIATADDGSEPIYVRQYNGEFNTLTRTLTLMDENGNTEIPKDLEINGDFQVRNFARCWHGLTVTGRARNDGDDEGILVEYHDNNWACLTLGDSTGKRSCFALNRWDTPIWRYNNGSTSYDVKHPGKSGTLELTSHTHPYGLTLYSSIEVAKDKSALLSWSDIPELILLCANTGDVGAWLKNGSQGRAMAVIDGVTVYLDDPTVAYTSIAIRNDGYDTLKIRIYRFNM